MSEDILHSFALDSRALSVLASLQALLVENDINETVSTAWTSDNTSEIKELKGKWYGQWRHEVEAGFAKLTSVPRPALWPHGSGALEGQLKRLRESADRVPAGLVLLELATFDAYWPMQQGRTDFKGLSLVKEAHSSFLDAASSNLGFQAHHARTLRDAVASAQTSISGYWFKLGVGVAAGLGLGALTFGLAAPFIAGATGAGMGLAGAAGVNAGLAALGGGAIAAGGFGMTGGLVALVGGGALLGVGTGGIAGRVAAGMTAETVLLSAAKLEVVLREFILQGQRDVAKVQEVLFAQRRAIQALEEELDCLRTADEKSDDQIESLEQSIILLQDALKRNQRMVAA